MPKRPRSPRVVALSLLLAACGMIACSNNAGIPSETPSSELPALIVPPEVIAQAGHSSPSGSGSGSDAYRPYVPGPTGDGGSQPDDVVADNSHDEPEAQEEPAPKAKATPTASEDRSGPLTLVTAAPQPSSYALIIGIEKYRDVPAATGARRDAQRFAEMARTTLGVPEDNVHLLLDDRASKTDIAKQIRWLQTNVPAGGRIYVYFSGHGAPDPTTGVSYIVPYDGDPQYLGESAIKMTQILGDLEKTKAKDVLAIADSCFSGAGGRSVLAPGTRPLVFVEKVKTTARVALLSASSGAEVSGPTADGKGGLFSKYLIDAIGSGQADINGDGQISLKELEDWIKPRVKREAKRANRDQTPNVQVGKKLGAPDDFIVSWGYAR